MSAPLVLHATIDSGSSVSTPVKLGHSPIVGAWIPVVNSAAWTIGVSFDTTSANFVPAMDGNANGIYAPVIAAGSRYLGFHDIVLSAGYIRFDGGAAQTDNRTITILFKVP